MHDPDDDGPYPDSKMRWVVVRVFTEGTRETKPPKRTPGPSDYEGRSTMGPAADINKEIGAGV